MNTDNLCPYCGQDKSKDRQKHFAELTAHLQKLIGECQEIMGKVNE